MILNRWSPRAMSGEKLTNGELMPLFEAARWAPSSFNGQFWRFIYAKRGTKNWKSFFNLLAKPNQAWCKDAGVLVVILSRKNFEYNGKPARTHSFDTGSAWENLALEGTRRGLVVHGMQGFDYTKAKKVVKAPKNYDVMAMIAIGKKGKKKDLPEELQKMESLSQRKPLKEIAMEGKFSGKK